MKIRKFNESEDFGYEPISGEKKDPMYTMKCCKFSDLPEDTIDKVFNDVYEGNRDQDMYSHIVGYYIGEYEEAVSRRGY